MITARKGTFRAGATPMPPSEALGVTKLLREQLQTLRMQLEAARTQNTSEAVAREEVIDTKDSAEREQQSQTGAALVARLADEIDATVAALEHVADRTYGTCIDCGGAIGHERLLVQPAALRCLACQSNHEHRGT